MDFRQMKSVIEGLLFVAGDEGLDAKQVAEVMELDVAFVNELILELQDDFKRQGRGIQIVHMAGGYRLTTVPEHAPFLEKLAYSPSRAALSQAALETLAIVAYKQPITRVEIEEIRGVKTERAIQTLVGKDLIQEVDRADAPGRPILYGTTKSFLDYFGLSSLEELPETAMFDDEDSLEEETRLLFEKLDGRQMTIDELEDAMAEGEARALDASARPY
ncbi:SMC-Scp complex subunit ScpB [Paenibacillus ginsengihumi]|uniref:SMC-Scp complex subunit ScpB n=1 Tax=Paenibacillus ginsengihumi TaxID=431596 RepID=UPI0003A34D20|nr:SMC-Scp complex subunit ScpB [Paenibacillus ginsengihumi]